MKIRTRISPRAALIACVFVASPVAAQQSLALSYKLDVGADGVQTTAPLVNPCAGFNWAALAGCGRELLARIAPARERPVGSVPAADDAASREAAASAPPAPAESVPLRSRAADLMLRLGSKHRFKATEDSGAEWYRFSDTTYQTHLQNNGHKALGVELLVPFQ